MTGWLRLCAIAALLLSTTACGTLGAARSDRAAAIALAARDDAVDCSRPDRCAVPRSPRRRRPDRKGRRATTR